MERNKLQFVGTWELQDFTITDKLTKRELKAYRGNARGHLIYSSDGWVSATIMEAGRKPVLDNRGKVGKLKQLLLQDADAVLDEEQISIIKQYYLAGSGYVAYCGVFEVLEGEVHHHVREAFLPQMIGATLTRRYDFSGEMLILTATTGNIQDRLTWKRSSQG